jgi:hypothetical protein
MGNDVDVETEGGCERPSDASDASVCVPVTPFRHILTRQA